MAARGNVRDATDFENWIDLAQFRAAEQAERIVLKFLIDGEDVLSSLTFAELDRSARAVAADLQERGAQGERVLLAFPPGLEFVTAFFGCLYAGAAAVPAYAPRRRHRNGRLTAIVRDAAPILALTTAETLKSFRDSQEDQPELSGLNWIAADLIAPSKAADWQAPQISRETLAFLQYTSGSTASPKGVMVSHGNLLANLRDLDQGFEHTDNSVIVSWLPLFHDLGLIYGMLMPVYRGISGVLMPPVAFIQEPLRWLRAMTEHHGTHSAAPNFAYDLCVNKISRDELFALDLSPWQMTLNAAEPIRAETLRRFAEHFAPCGFRASTLTPGYGLAEFTLKVTSDRASDDPQWCHLRSSDLVVGRLVECSEGTADAQTIVACGRSEIDTRIVIVDPETETVCAPDRVGEIWVSGASVAQGYWQREQETRETFQARLQETGDGPFLRTGDLGFVLRDRLYVTGRIKDLIIIRGLNFYPQDVELTVGCCDPAFLPDCGAAFSVEVDGHEELVVVQEVRRTDVRNLNVEHAASAIRRRVLDEHDLRVHAIALVKPGQVPKTSSGKIQRRQCRAMFLDKSLELVDQWQSPTSPTIGHEDTVPRPVGIVRQVDSIRDRQRYWLASRTNVPARDIDSAKPFADYGLDSLLAAELAIELENWLGIRVEPTVFWSYPTIDSLATFLSAALQDARLRIDSAASGVASVVSRTQGDQATAKSDVSDDDRIAIIGMACRLPGGANTPQAFWDLLSGGVDAITEIPSDRWDVARYFDPDPEARGKYYTKHGGFLDNVDGFDTSFFRITPREAADLDPQQRLLLEVTWEALENAGIPPSSLRESETGIFVGSSSDDYAEQSQRRSADDIDAYSSLGVLRSIAAGRIAYVLGTSGPAIQLDTACSSSLMAVYQACQSLSAGDCDLALAGGVNLMLSPRTTIGLCKLRALAPDGKCKPFDARANGYVRGEGCGAIVLKRLRDARREGDRVLAVIRSATANHDGASNGLTAPNGVAQERLLRKALQRSHVEPSQVSYVEAHGTGTALGDPIELAAIQRVYGPGRAADRPLYVGSVKANIGHLEAAAGIVGLIKVVLSLQHGRIPQQLHFEEPNPHIDWSQTSITIPTQPTPWPTSDGPRLASISSFGLSGTNVHLILEGARVDGEVRTFDRDQFFPLPLSAKTPEALVALAAGFARCLADEAAHSLHDISYTAAVGRDHHEHRLCVVGKTRQEIHEKLSTFVAGRHPTRDGNVQANAANTETTLESLARQYVSGVDVDWQHHHRESRGQRVTLPAYPFQRQRCWLEIDDEAVSSPTESASWMPRPQEVASQVSDLLPGMEDQIRKLTPRLDEIALRFIIGTLQELGCAWQVGQLFSADDLVQRLSERHRPKLQRLIRHLIDRGLLARVGAECRVEQPQPDVSAGQLLEELEREDSSPEIALVKRTGRELTAVLRGEVEALSLLFPKGSTSEAAKFYSEAPLFRNYNRLASHVLRRVIERLPVGGRLRLLEIGAGTGGLTRHLLPELPDDRSEYVFTDLSPLFLSAAQREFSQFSSLRTAIVDVTRSAEENNLEPGTFDFIIAANVLHATPDLRVTLANVHRLLKRDGWLVLLEGTNPALWGDVVFALIDGWWLFEDKDLRPDYPLMPPERWSSVLKETGFSSVVGLSDQGDSTHTLFLAQAGAAVMRPVGRPLLAVERTTGKSTRPTSDHSKSNVRPSEGLTTRVCELTARLMQMSLGEINPRASLMGLGMDSLMMLEMRTIIERETGVELSMQLLTSDPSIESIAVYLHEHHANNTSGSVAGSEDISHATDTGGEWIKPERQAGSKMLVRLQPEGNLPPLFFVPAGYGDLIAFQEVANILGQDRPVFGLQAPGARQVKELPNLTLDQLISTYLAEIKTVQPTGPYYLSGYSAGGIIAVELARELLRTGNPIALLVAIDPPVNVPSWLNALYSAAYTVCEQTRLSSLVRRSGSHLLRRLFHAVLDEGLRTHTSVLCGHQLESYPGHIDYFRATRSWVSILSLRRCGKFWKHIARGGTEVHWVPGTHYGMLRGGSVAVFAERLRACLKQCAEQVK